MADRNYPRMAVPMVSAGWLPVRTTRRRWTAYRRGLSAACAGISPGVFASAANRARPRSAEPWLPESAERHLPTADRSGRPGGGWPHGRGRWRRRCGEGSVRMVSPSREHRRHRLQTFRTLAAILSDYHTTGFISARMSSPSVDNCQACRGYGYPWINPWIYPWILCWHTC